MSGYEHSTNSGMENTDLDESEGELEVSDDEDEMELEADSDQEEVNSQYNSCYCDSTTTLFSEITDYKFEHGRRYHAYAEGSYWAPNDEQQNTQLELFHHMFLAMLNNELYLSPIEPKSVLDLGTGTGVWAIEIADRFPNAQVLGNDLSPIQPSWIPPNCRFEIDDFTRPWIHEPESFDFIFARSLYACVSNWNVLLTEAYNALEPGGWFENLEIDPQLWCDGSKLPESTALRQASDLACVASEKFGREMAVAGKVGGWLQKRGFINVQQKCFQIPVGPWPKDERMKRIGKLAFVSILEGVEGFFTALFTRHLGWTHERMKEFLDQYLKEFTSRTSRIYLKIYVAYGQKPPTEDSPMSGMDSAYNSGYTSARSGVTTAS